MQGRLVWWDSYQKCSVRQQNVIYYNYDMLSLILQPLLFALCSAPEFFFFLFQVLKWWVERELKLSLVISPPPSSHVHTHKA